MTLIIIYYKKMESNAQSTNKIDGLDTQSFRYLQFKSDLAKFHEKSFKKAIKLLEKEEWVLDMNVYTNVNMKTLVSNIYEARSVKIWLGYNARPQILIDIVTINFPNLKELSLAHNQIQSIQALAFLNIPKLQQLQLRQNMISSVKVFKKLHLPELKVVSFYRNFTLEPNEINQIFSKNIKNIWLQYQDDQTVQGQSLAYISKLQSSQLKSIAGASSDRIKQSNLEKCVAKKYNGLKIFRSLK